MVRHLALSCSLGREILRFAPLQCDGMLRALSEPDKLTSGSQRRAGRGHHSPPTGGDLMTTPAEVLSMIKEKEVRFVDLRFTDTRGKEQHVSLPAHTIDESFFEEGKMFDGSSIAGWKGINESDMVLMPDPESAVIVPFFEETTMLLRGDVLEPSTMQGYDRDPRSIAKRAEAYLKATGIGDTALFGPENEF